jgi:hypothetical protein
MVDADTTLDYDRRFEVALFRYGLIPDIVRLCPGKACTDASRKRLRRDTPSLAPSELVLQPRPFAVGSGYIAKADSRDFCLSSEPIVASFACSQKPQSKP